MTGFVIFVVVMIVVSLISKAKQQANQNGGRSSARMQALVERLQAQQAGSQPAQFQGQFTQPAGQPGVAPGQPGGPGIFPVQTGPQGSQQAAAMLQQLMQNGRQPRRPDELASPGQPQYTPEPFYPGQYNPAPYNQGQYPPPAHRPPQNNLPRPTQDLDAQVRELMAAGNEVGAIRLLSDERDLGILEAQKYARELVTPQAARGQQADVPEDSGDWDALDHTDTDADADADEERYVGSAAFAESIFNLDDREENVWASGWVDTPEPDDRSDIEELWQTVSNPPRPTPPGAQ
ncbi:hypothetical protein [Kribbella sp. NPDC048915]|uniref:hypothetical protein n=1 Tax=Kribbella sp. NPDC048915 TaxID=3155148 RepID=UPI0033C7D390